MSNILIHCDDPTHPHLDWKFGNYTRTPDGWTFTATGKNPDRWTETYQGSTKYYIKCKHCRKTVQIRADRLHPALDTLTDAGVTTLSLRTMAALERYLPQPAETPR